MAETRELASGRLLLDNPAEAVARLRLNSPEKRNPLDHEVLDAIAAILPELAEGIDDLARTARAGRTSLSDTREGTITITNFGVFGIDSGTPILNPGESVIVGVGAIKEKPWVVDGQLVPRQVAQLALSFDHRLIDGALGAELLRDVSAVLEDPALGLVWG